MELKYVLFKDHWYPYFGFLVTFPLGFKARVNSALIAFCRGKCNVHSTRSTSDATPADLGIQYCNWSLPHMHQLRWELAHTWMGNPLHRRRTGYHCVRDPVVHAKSWHWLSFIYLVMLHEITKSCKSHQTLRYLKLKASKYIVKTFLHHICFEPINCGI